LVEILHDHDDWIVINKPAGLSVHNNEDKDNVLLNLEKQGFSGFSAVNRLDKDTSGIMLLSKNSQYSALLQQVLSLSTTIKKYLSIVKGNFPQTITSGSWSQDLTNKAEGRNNPEGKKSERVNCLTHFKILNQNRYLSLLFLHIETGRQHQIRKHCVLNKHQVVGDSRYGDKKFNLLIQKKYSFNEMALHSYSLMFHFQDQEFNFQAQPPQCWKALDVYSEDILNNCNFLAE